MEKARRLTILILLVALFAGTQWAAARNVSADSAFSRPITTIVVDGISVRSSEAAADLAISFVSLLDTLQSDDLFMLMVTDDSTHFVGPYKPTDPAYHQVRADFDAILRWPVTIRSDGVEKALLETHATLTEQRAAEGSSIYLLVGDSPQNDFDSLSSSLGPLVAKLAERGWALNGVSLPGASGAAKSFLSQASSGSGGQVVDLSTHVGLTAAAHVVLGQQARGALTQVGSRTLSRNEIMSLVVSVAPGTSSTSILIFRDSAQGSFQLSDPTGFAISEERTAYSVREMPNAIVWEIEDPTPGHWKVDGRGIDGNVSVWDYSSNSYSIALQPVGTVPLAESASLVAYVADGDRLVKLDGAQVIARVTAPDATIVQLEMRDDGTGADQMAGDGLYSVELPSLPSAGEHKVQLELTWAEFNHSVTSFDTFQAETYPSILVDIPEVGDLTPGERTHVADVLVHIDRAPYSVPQGALIPIVNASPGSEAEVEIVPRSLFGEGPAWEYDVYLTVSEPGTYSVAIQLNAEFGGTAFSRLSEMIVLRSGDAQAPAAAPPVEKPAEAQPVVVQPAEAQPVVVQPRRRSAAGRSPARRRAGGRARSSAARACPGNAGPTVIPVDSTSGSAPAGGCRRRGSLLPAADAAIRVHIRRQGGATGGLLRDKEESARGHLPQELRERRRAAHTRARTRGVQVLRTLHTHLQGQGQPVDSARQQPAAGRPCRRPGQDVDRRPRQALHVPDGGSRPTGGDGPGGGSQRGLTRQEN